MSAALRWGNKEAQILHPLQGSIWKLCKLKPQNQFNETQTAEFCTALKEASVSEPAGAWEIFHLRE